MSRPAAFGKGLGWLNSDSQILGRTTFAPHEHGILFTLDIPGEEFPLQVAFKKKNLSSAEQFCEMARSTIYERRAEQEATADRKGLEQLYGSPPAEQAPGEVHTQATQEASGFDPLDREGVAARLLYIPRRLFDLASEAGELQREEEKLIKIMEVLDEYAPKANEAALPSVPATEEGRDTEGMDTQPCTEEPDEGGSSDPVRDDTRDAAPSLDALPDG